MFVTYRSFSVILLAPVAAFGAVLLTDPALKEPAGGDQLGAHPGRGSMQK